MKIDDRTTGFSFNVKKGKIKDMKRISKKKGTTMSDMIRGYIDRAIKANKDLLD
jgi:hypothetical protein